MEKFILERLHPVPFTLNGRKKDEDATEQEKSDARASIGALTWAAKEGRPDCAAGASIIASCLNKLKVQDVIDLNKTIEEAKVHADLTVTIQPIEEEKMCVGVVTDASYANTEAYSSQGGCGILCYDRELEKNGVGRGNLLYWKSAKIHRIVNPTLAAETQALAKGLQELAWSITVYNEMADPEFDLKGWEKNAKQRRLMAVARENVDETLRQGLCLVDAKSLFDHLVKSTVGSTDDRRTAIEMQLVRQSMQETGTCVQWISHKRMIIDCLTKRFGNKEPLYQFLKSGLLNFSQVQPT